MDTNMLTSLLKEHMRERGMSLRQAAKEIGVSHTTISRILGGQTADIDTLVAIAKWMKISPSTLMDTGGEADSKTLSAKIAAVIEQHPDLAKVFDEALSRFEAGKISTETITDLIAYMNYRLGIGGSRE